jgi:peptide deformylase
VDPPLLNLSWSNTLSVDREVYRMTVTVTYNFSNSFQARPRFSVFAEPRPTSQTGMDDSAGMISVRPWLITKSTAASSSLGHLSRWASITPNPLRSLTCNNGKELNPLSTGRRQVEKCVTSNLGCEKGCASSRKAGMVFSELGVTKQGQIRHNSGYKGRHRSALVCNARGFLSELQSLREEKADVVKAPVEFESPLEIVLYPDPRLRNKNKRVTVFDEKLQQLVSEMFEVMYRTDGVGLAAPQVGVNVRLMLYNPEGVKGEGQEYILVNPKIVKYGKQTDVATEGCLSFLKLEADVERSLSVRVEAQDIKGKKFGLTLKGWQARIFQHEYDHLEGILFHDRMIPEEVDKIRAGLTQLEDEYEKRVGQPAPERVKNDQVAVLSSD